MSSDLPKRLRMCFSVQDDSEAAIIAEAAAEIERLERELAEAMKAASGDPDSCIALTGKLHFRAMDAESSLAQAKARIAEIHGLTFEPRLCRDCADNDGMCPNDNLPCDPGKREQAIRQRIHTLSTDKDTA